MSTSTPKHRVRVEAEIERSREEGNWKRCLELSQQLAPEQTQLMQFLMGEAKLEKFLETGKDTGSSVLLMDAKKHLNLCLNSSGASPLSMDANLLLSKAHYVHGDYAEALRCIEISGIEPITRVEKSLPLRVMKLVAESFAVKGMSLEKEFPADEEDEARTTCLSRASDLSLRFIQNMEKLQGQYAVISLGNILETAIQRGPMLFIQNKKMDKAMFQYRCFMNACETHSTLNMRQVISRQLAEVILRGISHSSWQKFDTSITTTTGPWKPYRYFGQSLFVPREREEEIVLLLLISEMLAARNVVLDRSSEFNEPRTQSLETVTVIYDLIAIALTPFSNFYLDCYERAMKFSFEVKHIWFQFALALIESKKNPTRALYILQEVSRIDPQDPLPPLLGAKLCITELNQNADALSLAQQAFKRCDDNNSLYSKICLVVGVAHALLYEEGTDSVRKIRQENLTEAISYFKKAAKSNPEDHLPYLHLAFLMGYQRAINDAVNYAQIALTLNPQHLPTIKLLILCLSALKQYQEALDLCETALEEYPDHLILLYIKCHLEEVVFEDGHENALLTAKHMLRCWKMTSSEDNEKHVYRSNSYLTGANCDTQSLRMEQTLSEVTSMDSGPHLGDHSHHSSFSTSSKDKQLHNIQMHIWILIVELYIKLGQINEAEACISEGINIIFNPISHQLMYVKGFLSKAKGNLLEAKTYLQNAISINPKHGKALQQLGHTYYLLGNQMAADKYLRDSLTVDSTQHETWSIMGLVLDAMGDHERAIECQTTAIQLDASAPILPFNIIPRAVLI